MQQATPLAGLHAVISGGGTGLGLATARSMHQAGARVTLLGRRGDVLKQAVASIGARAGFLVTDLSDLSTIAETVASLESIEPIEILVNNAGTHHKAPTLDTTDQDFQRVVETNLFGTFALTREVARSMTQRGSGSIIIITSMAALFGIPNVAAYSASKSAIAGLTRQLAVEFGPTGVRVNAIAPGFIETDMNRDIFRNDPDRLKKVLDRTPLGVLGTPEDVAETALFLASPAARYLTGVSIPVDGGTSIGF